MTVFCAAPGFAAQVEPNWQPIQRLLCNSTCCLPWLDGVPEGTGGLPGLAGRLNPILDHLDRMYLYAANIAIDEGKPPTGALHG